MQVFNLKEEEFQCIQKMTYEHIGVKLTEAKKPLIVSRLSRRLRSLNFNSFSRYCEHVQDNPEELETMVNLLTTNVTRFFREKHHFDFLQERFFPQIVKEEEAGKRKKKIKIWSAGCSTGEEPYSIAIILEDFRQKNPGWDYRVLASDVNSEVLEEAETGIYPWEKVKTVSYELLKDSFAMGTGDKKGLFKVKDRIRKRMIFSRINLNRGEEYPRSKDLDVIFCRNVFIYFARETQDQFLERFAARLRPGGYLFLGHSETISFQTQQKQGWKSVQHTVFQKV